VVIDEDGNVQTVCDQPVFGIIKDLAVLPWNDKFRACRPQVCVMAISFWVDISRVRFFNISAVSPMFSIAYRGK
jgi:hypothetical protein